jgi:predicted Zn finger-like uncharacterized protein
MDIRIRCPHCDSKLVVDDDLIGQSVRCEECQRPFAVEMPEAPAASAPRRRRPRADDDDPDERSIDDYEFDDDRPIRRKPRVKPNALAPVVFGASLVLVMLLVSIGFFFAFGFGLPVGSTPVPPGAKFRLSNAGWIPNQGLAIDIETVDGRPPAGGHRIVWRTTDGSGNGHSTLRMPGSHRTHIVPMPRLANRAIEIWIEDEPPTGGAKTSNVILLR